MNLNELEELIFLGILSCIFFLIFVGIFHYINTRIIALEIIFLLFLLVFLLIVNRISIKYN